MGWQRLQPIAMKTLIFALIFALCSPLLTHQLFAQSQIVGTWLVATKDSKIEIYEQKGVYYGKISWLYDPTAKDQYNPNPKLKTRPLLGVVLLSGFKYNPKTKIWEIGNIYNARDGKNYRSEMELQNQNTLLLRGYWTIFYKTEILKRVL